LDAAECHWGRSDFNAARRSILYGFEFGPPRAEACCTLAWWYLQRNELPQATAWYEIAAGLHQPVPDLGFSVPATWGIGPHLQLCLCYSLMGNSDRARKHNRRAAEYDPNHPAVLHNRTVLGD